MSNIRVTKLFRFEMAHALMGYDGPCKNIHGHSYELQVTVIGPVMDDPGHPKNGMVIDFTLLKGIVEAEIVKKMDHALLLEKSSGYLPQLSSSEMVGKIKLMDRTPTCENILADMAEIIMSKLPGTVKLHHLRLSETSTSFAEWYLEDNLS